MSVIEATFKHKKHKNYEIFSAISTQKSLEKQEHFLDETDDTVPASLEAFETTELVYFDDAVYFSDEPEAGEEADGA